MIDPSALLAAGNGPVSANADLTSAMLQNQAWLAALQPSMVETSPGHLEGTGASQIRIGIDGAGLLVLDEDGARRFASAATLHLGADGRLLDAAGRAVVGRMPGAGASGRLEPLRIGKKLPHLYGFDVDAWGRWYATTVTHATKSKPAGLQRVDLGQLAIAIFTAPDALQPAGAASLAATRASGAAYYAFGGAANVGTFVHNPARPTFDDLLANLRSLWALSGRADIEVALASSRDFLARTALNLVR